MSWSLVNDACEPRSEKLRESLSALGNGHVCARGAFACTSAADAVHYPGTYEATRTRLRESSQPGVAPMIENAYRSRFRKLVPGDTHEFRFIRPRERRRGNSGAETTDVE